MSVTISDLSHKQKREFLGNNRNLIACLDISGEDLFRKISADLALDESAEEAAMFFAEGCDQTHKFARDCAREEFSKAMYQQFCLSFLKLRTRGAVQYSIALPPEAQEELYELEVSSEIGRAHV